MSNNTAPADWKLVPVEPTPEILDAMRRTDQDGSKRDIHDPYLRWVYHAAVSTAPPAPSMWRPIAEASEVRETGACVDLWGRLAKDQFSPCVPARRITDCRYRLSDTPDSFWGWLTKDGQQVAATHFMRTPAPPAPAEEGGK